jgi:uncharacterized protein (TIGR03083 family)
MNDRIQTAHLFQPLNNELITLLLSLDDADWNHPTLARLWTVKDVAAHLLDTAVRTLAERDHYQVPVGKRMDNYIDLVNYLNELNAGWVTAMRRMSPKLLIELLRLCGDEHAAFQQTRNMDGKAPYSVAWTGENESVMWFHVAREYTERWHHQQQIREATGKPGIMTREFYYPFIATLLYGLSYTYREVKAAPGTAIHIQIPEDIGGDWFLSYDHKTWKLSTEAPPDIHAGLSIPADIAWKLFTKGITPQTARNQVILTGDQELAAIALNLLAVMA